MKCKVAIVSIALLFAANSWAETVPYYSVEEISVTATGAKYGPYPSAISDDGTLIGTYSMKALLSRDIDIGLPFTFNRSCQYDTVWCELRFYGSENSSDLSNGNAYQAWRDAQYNAQSSDYSSYMMGNFIDTSVDTATTTTSAATDDSDIDILTYDNSDSEILPYDEGDGDTDVKVTDVAVIDSKNLVVGYSSDAYDSSYERDFVRRAFVSNETSDVVISLSPDFDTNGGLTSAYKVKKVTIDGDDKTLVVGSSSYSYPNDDDSDDEENYFNYCYGLDDYDDDEIGTLNNLVYCPGFDTQAWAWDVSGAVSTAGSVDGFALASEWLDDNEDNDSSDITYSASALDINASGIAVGVSTFEYSDSATGGRQRAIIMTPYTDDSGDDSYDSDDNVSYDSDGNVDYGAPIELSKASYSEDEGDSGDDDSTYNTWAVAITDGDPDDVMVIGNRELSVSKNSNKATEFFVYNLTDDSIDIPLKDKKVQTRKQKEDEDSSSYDGANSRAYDINESGLIVGKADDYDQTHPVNGGMPRTQAAFLYDSDEDSDDYDESWFINDLICSEDDDGTVTSPRYKIRSARVISDEQSDGTYYVLAEGWKYDTDDDYQNKTNASQVMLKLSHSTDTSINASTPDDSPNCWNSALLDTEDESYERSGAASFWLWIFALPLLLVRRFYK